jgi:hypothetical protein
MAASGGLPGLQANQPQNKKGCCWAKFDNTICTYFSLEFPNAGSQIGS